MTKKQKEPINFPTLVCVECGAPAPPYEKWTHDDEGKLYLIGTDMWPTYYRDILGYRFEFCSAKCGLHYMQNRKPNNDPL